MKKSPSHSILRTIIALVLFVNTVHALAPTGDRTSMSDPKVRTRTAPLIQSELKEKLDGSTTRMLNEYYDTWENYANDIYEYDGAGNMIVSVYRIWDDSSAQWQNHERSENTFDGNRNLLSETVYMWNEVELQWYEHYRSVYTYTPDGKISECFDYHQTFDDTISLSGRSEYEYNADGNIERITNYWWNDDSAAFAMSAKQEYAYDASGNNTQFVQYYRYDNAWQPSYKNDLAFDGNGNETERIYSYWDQDHWVPQNRNVTDYNADNYPVERVSYWWDSVESTWNESQKSENSYDTNHNLVTQLSYTWTGAWTLNWKTEVEFDTSVEFSELAMPLWYYNMSLRDNNKRVSEASYTKVTDGWKKTYETDYDYSTFTVTGIRQHIATPFRIFPNPTQDILYVNPGRNNDLYTLELFNLAGKRIAYGTHYGISQLPLNNLPRGVYIVRMSTHDQLPQTRRIILK